MNLTDKEKEYLNSLKKLEEQHFRLRYINLAISATSLSLSFGLLIFFINHNDVAFVKWYANHPVFYLLCIVGGLSLNRAIRGWRGDPSTKLLIKVTEELNNNERI